MKNGGIMLVFGFLVALTFAMILSAVQANAEPTPQQRTEQQMIERPSGKIYLLCYLSVINRETGRTILLCEPLTGKDA